MEYYWYEIGILIAVMSFLGFIIENSWLLITKGCINNRNMNLPFLLGYGLAVVAIYFLIGTPEKMVILGHYQVKYKRRIRVMLYFLICMLCVSVGEIVLGTFTEKVCHIHYWDYTWIPMHITKYTSIPTSAGFAAGITIIMQRIFPWIMAKIRAADGYGVKCLAVVLIIALTADFLYSYGKMIHDKNFYKRWELAIGHGRLLSGEGMLHFKIR